MEKNSKLEIPEQIIELITGKKGDISLEFEKLEVHVPKDGLFGDSHDVWKLNGTLKILGDNSNGSK